MRIQFSYTVILSSLFAALAVCPLWAQNGTLKLKVAPNDAAVFVDGTYLGPAGYFAAGSKYSVATGEHEIKLVDPRYEDFITKVSITSGKTTVLKQAMKPKELITPPWGLLRVKSTNPKAGVFLNDYFYAFVDEIDNSFQGLRLKPGEYDLKVVSPGSADYTEKVKIEADKVTLVRTSK